MVNNIVNFLYIFFYIGPFAVLRYYPFRDRLRLPVKALCALYLVLISFQAGLFCVLSGMSYWTSGHTQSYRMWFLLFYAILALTLILDRIFRQLYVWALTCAFAGAVFAVANFIEGRFFPRLAAEYPHAVTTAAVALILMAFFPTFLRLTDRMTNLSIPMDNGGIWNIVWLTPVLVDCGTLLATWSIEPQDVSKFSYLIIRLLCFGSMVCFTLVLSEALHQIIENAKLTEHARMIDAQLALQEDAYLRLETNIRETKAARHDLRHHLTVIQSYLMADESKRLKDYLDEYILSLPAERELMLCQNYAINVISAHFIEAARAKGISVSAELNVPQDLGIASTDLSIVFGNCLENALEACTRINEGDRFISIKSVCSGNMLVLLMENSFDGKLNYDGAELQSSKREGNGTGISSVRAIVTKYQGIAKFENSDHVFQVSIMLQAK